MSEHSRKRRRSRRHSHRSIRWFLFVLSVVLLAAGTVLLVWAARDRNEVPRRFGIVYAAGGAATLVMCGIMTARSRLSGRRRAALEGGSCDSRSGLALLVMLILMAFLSGVVIHSQVSARMSLRAEDARRNRFLLRTAALDAARDRLRALAATPDKPVLQNASEERRPAGITTTVTVRPFDRSALPPPLQRQGTPLFGQYFTLAVQAVSDRGTGMARGLACRLPSGEIRVLGWWEQP